MSIITPVTSRIDHITFDLLSCVNELQGLRDQLTLQDVKQIRHINQKLHDLMGYSSITLKKIVEVI
ncbi:hypothetical protein Lsan_2925 [Legionella santicrucis]|uniref:Uncharacterized protein n=1 Tax=Legionella santicrucis TaxID=45074 RepID=A0A0W0YII5_9GAMM|nr:hypothetical protein [Legionella santicrucis]KTD56765.1 hypothetical protein Lsan_2925 [Legionella santicrucis]